MRTLTRGWSLPIRKRALDFGLFGHSRYTPFIVLGRSRVGSNLLRGLLNTHPQIVAFGEVFRDITNLDWDHIGYFQTRSVTELAQRDPARFLETRLLGRYPTSVRAVGFKLFYYHARDGAQAGVWPWLLQRRDIRVIHLKRDNLLATHVSRKRAALTGRWVKTSAEEDRPLTLSLDYHEVLSDFEQTRAWETEADRAFSSHPVLQVRYEDLAADFHSAVLRLESFLGVETRHVQPSTLRQTTRPLSEMVSNYQELKARFAGTPWISLFTE